MMRRKYSFIIAWILNLGFLVGCVTPPIPDIDMTGQEANAPTTRTLSNDLVNGYYSTVLPYEPSTTRGLVYSFIDNTQSRLGNRFDIQELESSLMRASISFFDPSEVSLQEGQYLTQDLVRSLLSREGSNDTEELDLGLNPPLGTTILFGNTPIESTEVAPITYLAYLIEQNFITINKEGEQVLEGVSIGLALNPHFNQIDSSTGFTQNFVMEEREIIAEGEAIAERLIEILRTQEGLESVPIMLGLYVLEANSESVPGTLVSKAWVEQDSNQIGSWEPVDEKHFLLNNTNAAQLGELDANILSEFNHFRSRVEENYPHYNGVIGRAHFVNQDLYNLEITINTELYGYADKLGFHQVVEELIKDFSSSYNVTVTVSSGREIYGVIQRPANDEVMLQLGEYYPLKLPVVSSPTRGFIYSYLGNQFDIEELDASLMRGSTSYFNPNEVYFQEGQYLDRDLVRRLLRREGNPELEQPDIGLNPPVGSTLKIGNTEIESTEDDPITYLAYITEQNFITTNEEGEEVLEGVSIGLALNSHFNLNDTSAGISQNLEMDEQAIIAEGEAIAKRLIETLRMQEGLESVPIMIGLYMLEDDNAYVPGRLVSKTWIEQGSNQIGSWESVDEQHFLLNTTNPTLAELDPNIMDEFNYFQNTIQHYYPHLYGTIGRAHFVNSSLYDLEITINTEFYGLAEMLSFHQFLSELITEFSNTYNVKVTVHSDREVFGVIQRLANEDVVVRCFGW